MIESVSENAGAEPPDLKRTPRRKAALPDVTKVDRLPPHSPEAEQGVLGCVLLSPNECMGECSTKRNAGAAGKLANAPLFIDDSSGLPILQLRAKARRMRQQYGIKLFVIDYLQLLHSTARRAENRQQEIADISSGRCELDLFEVLYAV